VATSNTVVYCGLTAMWYYYVETPLSSPPTFRDLPAPMFRCHSVWNLGVIMKEMLLVEKLITCHMQVTFIKALDLGCKQLCSVRKDLGISGFSVVLSMYRR